MTEHKCKTPGCDFDKSKSYHHISLTPSNNSTIIINVVGESSSDMFTRGFICYQCLSEQQPKELYIQSCIGVIPRPVASFSLLSCLSYVVDFIMTSIDCSIIQQYIIDLIMMNKMPVRTMLVYCNLDVSAIVNAMATNTSVRELDITNNVVSYPYDEDFINNIIKFINTNTTCHTFEFYLLSNDDSYLPLLRCLENNYTLLSIFGDRHDGVGAMIHNKAVQQYLQRNAKYTRSVMTAILIDIIIALFPIIRQYELCPYVIMEIFGNIEPHYDKFWHKELTATAIIMVNNNKNEM